eukprot:g7525.t1
MSSLASSQNSEEAPPPTDGYGFKQGLGIQRWPSPAVVLASVTYHWPLTYVSKLLDEKCISDTFNVSGYNWRLKFTAKGPKAGQPIDEDTCASLFVESMTSSDTSRGPMASFALGVINQDDETKSLWRNCEHAFSKKMSDWGFEHMILLRDLMDPEKGFIVNDTLILGIRF